MCYNICIVPGRLRTPNVDNPRETAHRAGSLCQHSSMVERSHCKRLVSSSSLLVGSTDFFGCRLPPQSLVRLSLLFGGLCREVIPSNSSGTGQSAGGKSKGLNRANPDVGLTQSVLIPRYDLGSFQQWFRTDFVII